MNKIVKNTLILLVISLVAGLALSFVYELTKDTIAQAGLAQEQSIYSHFFPDGMSFEVYAGFEVSEANDIIEIAGFTDEQIHNMVTALGEGENVLGYIVNTSSASGFGGDIQLLVGISLDGTVIGLDFLVINETPGLGMPATQPDFTGQFAGINVESFTVTTTGESGDGVIDALSGATITTNAVVSAVNAALYYFNSQL